MIGADDRVEFEDGEPEEFTQFEWLVSRVNQIEKVINEHTEILRANRLNRVVQIEAPYINQDEIFRELEDGKD
jgi:hypothetical protein